MDAFSSATNEDRDRKNNLIKSDETLVEKAATVINSLRDINRGLFGGFVVRI